MHGSVPLILLSFSGTGWFHTDRVRTFAVRFVYFDGDSDSGSFSRLYVDSVPYRKASQ